MSNSNADRNMLFGVLALQMSFIEGEDLIAAVSAWIKDKSQPLDEILIRQGRLDAEQRDLLKPLVDAHVRQHHDQPGQSLAAVSSIGSLREQLQSLGDAELDASLARLTAVAPQPDPYATKDWSMGQSTSQGERFRILRPHAKGGLGQVSVALDSELNREVALKQIQSRYASHPESQARFTLEAEITGGLEHPGIVPVYGLGKYADGRPFYAMRFVRGDSLKQAIQRFHAPPAGGEFQAGQRSLEFRRLVGRFVDVCDAVEYAHSRGVLHRDLKPGNIMLGKYGETLVVDWGLAKAGGEQAPFAVSEEPALRPSSASGSAPTQMGSAMGTPQFMSPEQAAGRLDEMGPASDVFSLGATLYCLLTGQPPLTDDAVEDVLDKARRGEFPRPSAVKSGVPKALEAVCLKAMALDPADRYASARAIGEDIEHWLADEPVSAFRDSPADRLARWLRHHRGLAQAIALALLVVTMVSVAAAVLIDNERRRADRHATAALAAQKRAEEEKQRADKNAGLAGEQRDLALETLQKLVYEVQDKLGDKPGMQQLKEEILNLAIEGLNKVSRRVDMAAYEKKAVAAMQGKDARDRAEYLRGFEAGRRARIDYNLAIGLRRMGDIYLTSGRTREARAQFENSHKILQRLADETPNWTLGRRALAGAYEKLGDVHRRLGQPRQAIGDYEQALRIRESYAADNPHDTAGQYDLSLAYSNLGDLQLRLHNYPAALDGYRRARNIRGELAESLPGDRQTMLSLAYADYQLGRVSLQIGMLEQADEYFRRSLELRRKLAAAEPENREMQQLLAAGYTGLGNALLKMGQLDEARALFLERLALAEKMLQADPQSLRARLAMQLACHGLGVVSSRLGRLDEARDYCRREIELAEFRARESPDDLARQTLLAAGYHNFARNELRAGNVVGAARWSAKAAGTAAWLWAQGHVTEWDAAPEWVQGLLQVAHPRRGAIRVLHNPHFADARPPAVAQDLLVFRTAVLAAQGDIEGAAQSARQMEGIAGTDAAIWYDAARCYALCAAAQQRAAPAATPAAATAGDEPPTPHLAAAFRCLYQAVEFGLRDIARLKTDPDLRTLRGDNEFDALLNTLVRRSESGSGLRR